MLDSPLSFGAMCDLDGAVCGRQSVTPRALFDIASWGVSYELGTFWTGNEALRERCAVHLNESWFYESEEVESRGWSNFRVVSDGVGNVLRSMALWWLFNVVAVGFSVVL